MTFLLWALGSTALCLGEAGPAATFRIESPGQTARSVHLVWETDREVRTRRTVRRWSPSTPTGPTHRASMASGEGREGGTAAKVVGTASTENARGCFVQNIDELREPGKCDYRFFYRTGEQDEGRARVVIDCYQGDAREYHGLVSKSLPASEDWSEVAGTFELPEDVRFTRILLYQAGAGTAWFDDVSISRSDSPENRVASGGFEGAHSWRVFYRCKGDEPWQAVDAVVLERFHNVIFLEPETDYEFMVRRVSADGAVEAESQVLSAVTGATKDRVWRGLGFGPERAAPTPPSVYPCLESVRGKLHFCDSRGGILWLSELDDDFQARWTKAWVPPHPVDGRPCYQGQSQTAVLGHKLYVSWKRAYHGDAPHARQCVASYDTETGEIGEPLVIEPNDPDQSTWNGGIAAVGDQLWVSYCRWRPDGEGYKTTVTVRRLDYEARQLGPAFELDPQPTETPYTPFLSVFDGELVVTFTDSQSKTDMQPLWLVRFDGREFHGLMTVSPKGFNQYAKGLQQGDELLFVWKYGAPYPSDVFGRYMFHDIGLAAVDPVAGRVEITSLVDDLKYNSSPDLTLHGGRIVYTYNKFEHLYGGPADPGKLYGCFLGTITPTVVERGRRRPGNP
ncbi:MAG: hypothetical protein HQ582_23120 [Planctomycetes bacterium]|nr:hypothetical protein [Planctomycetota bacterium]